MKRIVKDVIKPAEDGVKVAGLRKGRSGVVVTTADDASWTVIMNHRKLKEKGLTVEAPAKRMPRIGVFGMNRALDAGEIVNLVRKQNFPDYPEEQFKAGFIPMFRTGRKDNVRGAWIIRCSPDIRGKIMDTGRVFIGWDVCRVEDEAGVTRCYKCQGYGHVAARCTAKPICGHCASEGHERKDCPRKAVIAAVCVNCKRFGKEYNHDVASRDCPFYVRQLDLLARMTDYGR